jgi:hypothetical protein
VEVEGFYQSFLGRTPGPAEVSLWMNAMLAGWTEADVTAAILGSAEFQAAHPSDAAFVEALYQDVLGRGASAPELAAWEQGLAHGLSRGQAVAAIQASPEALARVIAEDYADYLGRTPDPASEQALLGMLLAGGPGQESAVALGLLSSDEYFWRVTAS